MDDHTAAKKYRMGEDKSIGMVFGGRSVHVVASKEPW